MNEDLTGYLTSALSSRKRSHFFFYLIIILSVFISATVFWQFRLQGISKTQDVICGKEEHLHTEACYKNTLSCSFTHEHTNECYCQQLICTLTEHTHTVQCMSDNSADIETEDDYLGTIPKLTGESAGDLCRVAFSQLGYHESEKNYILLSDNRTTNGYTRYGDWYGTPYADWSGIFVSFCLNYAGISEEEFPYDSGAWARTLRLKSMNLYKEAHGYIPVNGDIVFLDTDQNGEPDTTAVIYSVDASASDNISLQVIQGDCNDKVDIYSLLHTDELIYGYGVLPKNQSVPAVTKDTASELNNNFCEPLTDMPKTENELPETEQTETEQSETELAETEQSETELSETETETTLPKTEDLLESIVIPRLSSKALKASGSTTISEGKYGNATLKYNREKNAYVTDEAYAVYRNNSSLGIAGDFHIVGFQSVTTQSHCNGNILTRSLSAGSNFGTKNLPNELTYVLSYEKVNGSSASGASHILALGSSAQLGLTDGNTAFTVNGTKIDSPKNIVKDASAAVPLIDFDYVEEQLRSLSLALAGQPNQGVTASFNDQNNRKLTITSKDGLMFYNFTASQLNSYTNNPLKIYGFSAGHTGVLVINVDCNNTDIYMPEALMYVDNEQQGTGEVSTFTNGYILWNFYNCDGKTITAKRMSGSVLAPGGDVVSTSNLNGSILAQNIKINGESHRNDFIGDLGEFSLNRVQSAPPITAELQINGVPAQNEGFQITLSRVENGELLSVDTVTQQNGTVTFTPDYDNGTEWYVLQQLPDTVTGDYYYDLTPVLIKSEKSGGATTITYYVPTDKTKTIEQIITGNGVNISLLSPLSEDTLPVFNNLETAFELPATGGNGILFFYSAGGILILFAVFGLLAVRKKRRYAEK